MAEAPIQITAHGEGWHDVPYIRWDVHQTEFEAVRREYAEDLPSLLAMVGCKTVEELAEKHRNLCAKVVFGQIDGETIAEAEKVLQQWNGDV